MPSPSPSFNPEVSAAAWQYTQERLHALQRACEGFLSRVQAEYLQPFDRILEKKAEYYLSIENDPTRAVSAKFLLEEIEMLDRFRQYVEVLEMAADEKQMAAWVVAAHEYEMIAREAIFWKAEAQAMADEAQFIIQICLNQFNQKPSKQ